jgi:hypothetical protein
VPRSDESAYDLKGNDFTSKCPRFRRDQAEGPSRSLRRPINRRVRIDGSCLRLDAVRPPEVSADRAEKVMADDPLSADDDGNGADERSLSCEAMKKRHSQYAACCQ